jgi:transposase-like protein
MKCYRCKSTRDLSLIKCIGKFWGKRKIWVCSHCRKTWHIAFKYIKE